MQGPEVDWRDGHWLTVLLPRHCALCGAPAEGAGVCPACRGDLPWVVRACERCGTPLPPDRDPPACVGCRVRMGGVSRMRSALVYEYPVDRMIGMMKFGSRIDLARTLGELLADFVAGSLAGEQPPDAIVAVPLHGRRLNDRGFNQAEEIARPVARLLDVPRPRKACARVNDTQPQMALSGRARIANVAGAFTAGGNVRGLRIAVIDDVVTTGSTVASVASALLKAGAESVDAWSVARVIRGA